jgi:hypothetical protein
MASRNIRQVLVNVILRGNYVERVFGIFEWLDTYNKLNPNQKKSLKFNFVWTGSPPTNYIKHNFTNNMVRANKNLIYPTNSMALAQLDNLPDIWWGIRETLMKPNIFNRRLNNNLREWIGVYLSHNIRPIQVKNIVEQINGFNRHGGIMIIGNIDVIKNAIPDIQNKTQLLNMQNENDLFKILSCGVFIAPVHDINAHFFYIMRNKVIPVKRV